MPLGMGAFHGYAHARDCQIDFHPRVADLGLGLEDSEGYERLLSKTNQFAGMSPVGVLPTVMSVADLLIVR